MAVCRIQMKWTTEGNERQSESRQQGTLLPNSDYRIGNGDKYETFEVSGGLGSSSNRRNGARRNQLGPGCNILFRCPVTNECVVHFPLSEMYIVNFTTVNTPHISPHVSPRNVVMQGPVKFT